MKNLLPTRALYAIFALLLLYARSSVSAAQGGYPAGKQYGNKDNWKLISAGNKTVQSLADLTDGVYFLQLSDTRLDCDKTSPDGM